MAHLESGRPFIGLDAGGAGRMPMTERRDAMYVVESERFAIAERCGL